MNIGGAYVFLIYVSFRVCAHYIGFLVNELAKLYSKNLYIKRDVSRLLYPESKDYLYLQNQKPVPKILNVYLYTLHIWEEGIVFLSAREELGTLAIGQSSIRQVYWMILIYHR